MNQKKINRDIIDKLKKETIEGLGSRVEINVKENYKFRIVSRGEQLFHQSGERALLVLMNPYEYTIYTESIKKWDDGEQISNDERMLIIERAKSYFNRYHDNDLIIV